MPIPTKVRCPLSTTQSVIPTFSEVLSLLIVNIDNLSPTIYDPIFRSAGLDTLSFAPTSSPIAAANWPTLGSMIDSGKRLVTFLDNAANLGSVPYLLDGTRIPPKPVYFLF